MTNLKEKPFYLSDEDIAWVNATIEGMTQDEKIAQLFCLIAYKSEPEFLESLAKDVKVGGLMCRPMPAAETKEVVNILQRNSKIPMLIAANLERGGVGAMSDGTSMGSHLAVAATDNDEMASRLGTICGREGAAVGINWSFAPIIDIDYNFRNPITNIRTFGSDPGRVKRMGVNYVTALQKEGLAASIKHFPGDGVDERDQHLVTAINSFACEEWDATFGSIYKACIDAGAMTVMIGHIMLPEYSRKLVPGIKDADILPASLAYELTTTLLKERLGFNGLVVSDATTMAGMTIPMCREKAVPQAIAAGCDMFLFTKNMDEDYAFMKKGVKDGIITPERLQDALTKILALKAALGLHKKQAEGKLLPTGEVPSIEEHRLWAKECADQAVTLVKEEKGVLPLSPQKYKSVLVYPIESEEGFAYSVRVGATGLFIDLLRKEGFNVDIFNPPADLEGRMEPYSAISDKYDLIVYIGNMGTRSNQTTIRIEWAMPMGTNVPIYMESVPTVFISIENPYHLLDVPRVKTFINTYASTDTMLEALMDKLTGRSPFRGVSPVDPFCGMWDTRL
ncbi:MAG: glycosyl hydrolase [Treponema sp.]|nr:glycosyl hydrolase [Treponema sp.]